MTTSQSRNLRKAGAVALSLALAMSTLAITPASAAKKVKLAKTKITVNVGKTKTVKIKNIKKKQVKKLTVKSSKATVAKAKASKKTAIKVTGKKAGSAKVTANLKLKKKVGGKKAYKLTLKVTVKKAAPAPVEPTAAPTAAPTPVVSGASISLDKPTGYKCSVKGAPVTVTANILPATSNEEVKWSVKDATIAAVSGTGATVNGVSTAVLTGLKEGTTQITAAIGAASATANVTVEKEVIAAKIVSGKQTKANAVEVTLDIDWKTDNQGFDKGKFDVDVYNAAGQITKTIPVNKVAASATASATGSSVVLNLDSPFADKDKFVVNLYKGKDYASKYEDVASVGAPVGVNIVTNEAQRDVETKIELALVDAKGIDVTSTVDVDSRVVLTAESAGDATWNLSPVSAANITMTKNGATATITAAYTAASNTTGKPDFQNSGVITCIEPKPTVGDPHFMKYDSTAAKTWNGSEDSVAKFYNGTEAKTAEVVVDGSQTYSFYASTQDDDKDAIKYDEYSVTSSNGDIASATVDKTGKYCNITVNGIKAGTCNINVTATKNTKPANYIIPVTVKNGGKFTTFTVSPKRASVSNTFDTVYQKENGFKITAKDDLGNDVKPEITFELTKPAAADVKGQTYKSEKGDEFTMTPSGDVLKGTGADTYFDASGLASTTYSIKATAVLGDVKKEVTTSVSVKAIPKACFTTGTNAEVKYQIEASSTELKLSKDQTSNIRVGAYQGGVFLGYVDGSGKIGNKEISATFTTTVGGEFTTKDVAVASAALWKNLNAPAGVSGLGGAKYGLKGVYMMVQAGVKWGTGDAATIRLNDRDNNFKAAKFTTGTSWATGGITISSVSNKATKEYWTDGKFDTDYAKAGSYTARVGFESAVDSKVTTADKTIKVTDDLFKPTVSVENRTLADFSIDGVKDALKCNVDLNSNDSNNASITDVYAWDAKNKKLADPDFSGKNVSIAFAKVTEGSINYYVALGASFNAKA